MPESSPSGPVAGVAAVCIAAVGIAGAALASPAFAVTANALSDLGQPGNAAATPLTTLLFDGGLVLSGVVGLRFGLARWRASDHVLDRLAAAALAVALLGMVGVGLFPADRPLHVPAALTLYLGSMVAMAADGAGDVLAGRRRRPSITLALVAVHVGVWSWWASGGAVLRPGLAIPELVGAAVFAAWVLLTARPNPVSIAATGPNS